MSPQPLDLRRSASMLRHRKRVVGTAVALGIAVGAVYAVLSPPTMSAKALVVLPGAAPNVATEVVVADSDPVLAGALPYVTSASSVAQLRKQIQITNLSSNILQVTATGRDASIAEANATAVVDSYISYIGSSASPVGKLTVRVLQPANAASGTSPVTHWAISCLIGGLGGALLGAILALAVARRDRRLRARDDIANSIGVPVLASLPVAHPTTAVQWRELLADYQPRPVYAWRLRKTLQQLTLAGVDLIGTKPSSVTMLSLASDTRALALGPQLAAFAASQGIDTCLIVGKDADAASTATLRTACSGQPAAGPNLQVMVASDDDSAPPDGAAFTVVVSTLDPREPHAGDLMHTTATLLGVGAGAATADQLAVCAVAAAVDGRDLTGILVADPDPEDQTTGRAPQLVRHNQNHAAPARATETRTQARR
jgi:hypothetical protein